MLYIKISILSVFIFALHGCSDDDDAPELGICGDPISIEFPLIIPEGNPIDTANQNITGRIYIPTAFTPNGDLVNDKFGVFCYALSPQILYQFHLYRNNSLFLSKTGWNVNSASLFEWDGRSPNGQIIPGMYRLSVLLFNNGQLLMQKNHYFHLLPSFPNGTLPPGYSCLWYPANFDPRFGLIYSDMENYN